MARRARNKLVEDALLSASARYNVPYHVLNSIMQVESGGNPTAATGSYQGLFQLSQSEFDRMMPNGGDILNPRDNAMAGAALMASHAEAYRNRFGGEPSLNELYMIHQQGWGGYMAHRANPDRPAWENMASTAEGRARGPEWAQRAIAGNIPRQFLQGRDPNWITSGEFMNIWDRRLNNTDQVQTRPSRQSAPVSPEGLSSEAGAYPSPEPERSGVRAPVETPSQQEPGFFDRQYPLVHAMTGQDKPIGDQLLGSIFGGPGLSTNRTSSNVGSGLRALGKGIADAASIRSPQLTAISAATPALPEQEEKAFQISPTPRRRPYA